MPADDSGRDPGAGAHQQSRAAAPPRQEVEAQLRQVADALSPLRAASSRSAIAHAVVRLLAGAAVACRVDVADDTRDARDWILLARTHRTGSADIAAAADDLGASAALADPGLLHSLVATLLILL